ncbi:hypothetical protein BVY01_04165 [bacterium I07]|nr:hypothetical protein BVY01_04165 [bacterium I07]
MSYQYLIMGIYIASIMTAVIIFRSHQQKINRLRNITGTPALTWSDRLNMWSLKGWFYIICMLLATVLGLHYVIKWPWRAYGHAYLIILMILLSVSQKWNVEFGSEGLMLQLNMIKWAEIESWRLISQDNAVFLEFTYRSRHLSKVRIPGRYAGEIYRLLLRTCPEKEIHG